MSLPTTAGKPSQTSIRSFFQAKPPQYAPPPSSKSNNSSIPLAPSAPPPDSTSPHSAAPPSRSSDRNQEAQELNNHQASSSSHPRLPLEASIRPITTADVNALRRLNALLLPVSYPETFYNRAADPVTGRFSRVICWAHKGDDQPKPVGGIVCRVEPDVDVRAAGSQTVQNIYIQSLCLLSPYRSLGLIAAALDDIIASAVTDPTLDVRTLTAHVWTENEEGLHWYEARGFQKQEPAIRGYYIKLRPDSAWLVSKPVSASVLGSLPSSAPPLSRPDISSTTAAVLSLPPMANQPPVRPPARVASGKSFQNQRPETEWNDLPADMAPSLLGPPKNGSEPGSGASSRSSSTVRRKKDRSYPAAAFGQ
ncbi:hypothetical protein M431DRAFT_92331 [Trichoderma harzianum CBS 226.95]|uniref:N-acetyltransferase domain-containing protein n=1 Tax=Trichoderma harzianum CBS 226.95 TaxID=983964 RepID=A0A2T4A3N9_TRIHA|nr:hypothetical protein M431DRAFT_92331 [Trichoderma harzianum CBS 226.95]PTB51583.1 hypothetical protein M431DRAFT_92331 [Trichoderma harzianum CBS 226.95]